MHSLWQDIRYGWRMLAKSPGFALVVAVTLGLGIGANTAIFSVADAFLLKPYPFPALDRMVLLDAPVPALAAFQNDVSVGDYEDWRQRSHSFEQLAAHQNSVMNLTGASEPERVFAILTTANFFDALGLKPFLGRGFLPHEDEPGRNMEVILSYGLWERAFGSSPDVLGRQIALDGRSYTVVGVMGKGLSYPPEAELWTPLALTAEAKSDRSHQPLGVFGLLAGGTTLSQARAEMDAIGRQLSEMYPQTNKDLRVRLLPMAQYAAGNLTRQYTLMLLGAVGFVLVIACANIAGLLFARGAMRQRELAVRAVLGASRWRVVRQMITETLLLALLGGALGVVLAQWSVSLILSNMPPETARFIAGWKEIKLDQRALLCALAVAVLSGIVSSVAPALMSSKADLNGDLKESARSTTGSRSRHRIGKILVVCQVALALVLLMGAGLIVRGTRALLGANQNSDPATLLTMGVFLPKSKYKDASAARTFDERAVAELQTIPGAQGAALVSKLPYANGGYIFLRPLSIEGRSAASTAEAPQAEFQSVSQQYLQMMRIALLQGREFTAQDGANTPPVALVSSVVAQRYWPRESPLGKHIRPGASAGPTGEWLTIVGVVGDVKSSWITRGADPEIYRLDRQFPDSAPSLVLRTPGDPLRFVAAARAALARIDPDQPISDIQTLEKLISNSVVGIQYVAVMLTVMGVMALVLASVGLYGVVSFMVAQRAHEVGVRLALGAQRQQVLRMFLWQGALLAAVGLAIGLPAGILLARLLASLFYGVSASDAAPLSAVAALLTVVTLLASYIPARRATSVDPLVALRYE